MIQFPLPQPMTIDEFLHKHHPVHGIQPWLNYCEICIDKQGIHLRMYPFPSGACHLLHVSNRTL